MVVECYGLDNETRTAEQITADLGGVPPGWSEGQPINDKRVLVSTRGLAIPPAGFLQLATWTSFQPTPLSGKDVEYLPGAYVITVKGANLAVVETEPASSPSSASQGTEELRTVTVPGSALSPGQTAVNIRTLIPEARNEVLYRMASVSASSAVSAGIFGLWAILVGMLTKATEAAFNRSWDDSGLGGVRPAQHQADCSERHDPRVDFEVPLSSGTSSTAAIATLAASKRPAAADTGR